MKFIANQSKTDYICSLKPRTMKQKRFIVAITATAMIAASCSPNKQKTEEAQQNVENALQQVEQLNDRLARESAHLDSVQHIIKYETPEQQEAAIAKAQEEVNGTKSVLENAQQKAEAAKQSFKDITGKEFSNVINAVADEAADAATKTANGEAINVEEKANNIGESAKNAGETIKNAAKQTAEDTKNAAKQTVEDAKNAAKENAEKKVDEANRKANEKISKAATKANDAINKAKEDANKKVDEGLNKLLNK